MGCVITNSPAPVCADKVKKSGIRNLWLANASQVAAVVYDLFGVEVVESITLSVVGNFFHKVNPKLFSAEYKESVKITNGISSVTQSLEFFIHAQAQELTGSLGSFIDPTAEVLRFLQELTDSDGLIAVWEDYVGTNGNPGNMYVAGLWDGEDTDFTKFGLRLSADEYSSGKALTDVNGNTVTISAEIPCRRKIFAGTLDESESA